MNLDQIPKIILVPSVLVLGIALIFFLSEPHTICHTQLEAFKEAQVGNLYPKKSGKITIPALIGRTQEACQFGNSAGACFEYFSVLKRFVKDLRNIPDNCGVLTFKEAEVSKALTQGVQIMLRVAWGDQPPADFQSKNNWLESADLALFCSLRDQWVRLKGKESWDEFRVQAAQILPAEPAKFEDGKCTNCESRATAAQKLSSDEIWKLSLFSTRCDLYR